MTWHRTLAACFLLASPFAASACVGEDPDLVGTPEVIDRDAGVPAAEGGLQDASSDARRPCVEGTRYEEDPATGHCYFRYDEPLSWQLARDRCVELGGHLATISNEAENMIAYRVGANSTTRAWLGASKIGTATFEWVTGEPFSYVNWGEGDPSGDGECMNFNTNYPAQWNDRFCEEGKSYVCERE
ncbi:MAG: Cell surface protein [Labilithrix sp.]|nr:Cell surface protein [Labilithrix sp.]